MYQPSIDKLLRPMTRAMSVVGLGAAATLIVAACGTGGGGARSSPVGMMDMAARTVQLNLIITGSNFNGYSNGEMTVRVPRGWKVVVYCSNQTPAPHSCAIVPDAGSRAPAFAGAASPNPVAGVAPGASANFSFVVGKVGAYRLTSLVPRREDRGMWEHFEVVAAGRPSVSTSRQSGGEPVAPGM